MVVYIFFATYITAQSITFKASDGVQLHGWLIHHGLAHSKNVPTLIYFHGNAGNIGLRMPNYKELHARCGVNIFAIDYRGYGDSTGRPTERGLKLDGIAALRFVTEEMRLFFLLPCTSKLSTAFVTAAFVPRSFALQPHTL